MSSEDEQPPTKKKKKNDKPSKHPKKPKEKTKTTLAKRVHARKIYAQFRLEGKRKTHLDTLVKTTYDKIMKRYKDPKPRFVCCAYEPKTSLMHVYLEMEKQLDIVSKKHFDYLEFDECVSCENDGNGLKREALEDRVKAAGTGPDEGKWPCFMWPEPVAEQAKAEIKAAQDPIRIAAFAPKGGKIAHDKSVLKGIVKALKAGYTVDQISDSGNDDFEVYIYEHEAKVNRIAEAIRRKLVRKKQRSLSGDAYFGETGGLEEVSAFHVPDPIDDDDAGDGGTRDMDVDDTENEDPQHLSSKDKQKKNKHKQPKIASSSKRGFVEPGTTEHHPYVADRTPTGRLSASSGSESEPMVTHIFSLFNHIISQQKLMLIILP